MTVYRYRPPQGRLPAVTEATSSQEAGSASSRQHRSSDASSFHTTPRSSLEAMRTSQDRRSQDRHSFERPAQIPEYPGG